MCSAHVTEVSSASSDSSLFLHAPAGLLWFLPQMNLLIVVCLVFFITHSGICSAVWIKTFELGSDVKQKDFM